MNHKKVIEKHAPLTFREWMEIFKMTTIGMMGGLTYGSAFKGYKGMIVVSIIGGWCCGYGTYKNTIKSR